MLAPRFSIRTLMVILTAGAVACLIVGMAFRGKYWALGASVAFLCLILAAFVHAALFGVIWLLSALAPAKGKNAEANRE